MLTIKVKMYAGYIDSLRTIHDCKFIAAITTIPTGKKGASN